MYIRTYLTYTRNSDLRTRVHTYVLIRRCTLVLCDAYVHMRAYTRAQRPSVALCLRPEISLACLANHGLDNNTVIDRTNLVLHRLLFFHVQPPPPRPPSPRSTYRLLETSNVPPLEIERERKREIKEERERSRPFRTLLTFSLLFALYLSSGSPCCAMTYRSLSHSAIFLFPSRRRERLRACRVLTGRPRSPRTRTGSHTRRCIFM